jgi:ribonuclease HII
MFDQIYFQKINNSRSVFYAGADEVGRGPLAGPVVACVVAVEQKEKNEEEFFQLLMTLQDIGVIDSKKISARKRNDILSKLEISLISDQELEIKVSNNLKLKYSIKEISVDEIDRINILQASLLAMKGAFEKLELIGSGILLIDGNKKFNCNLKGEILTIIQGDLKSMIIGLASIIAKQYRDQLMDKISREFPFYDWDKNAGYGTKMHLNRIQQYGVTKYHRKTFKGVKEIYEERRII